MHNHTKMYGKTERQSFSRIPQVLELPNLLAIQKDSFEWFLKEGLREVLEDISPIRDYSGGLILDFVDYHFDEEMEYTVEEAKERDVNYSRKLKVKVRLVKMEDGEIMDVKEQEVYLGDIPMMTPSGTFIINGAERVIVSQLIRSPGVYYAKDYDKSGNTMISSTVIPNRGAWLEYDNDANGVVNVRIDRTRKLPATTLIRALLFESDQEMIEVLGDSEALQRTLEKETSRTRDDAKLEIYRKLKPGDPASLESADPLIHNLFFDPRRYDLARVGRYKFNKKLSVFDRILNQHLAADVITEDGEILADKGQFIDENLAQTIENAGVNSVDIISPLDEEQTVRVVGNHFVSYHVFEEELEGVDLESLHLSEKVYWPAMQEILELFANDENGEYATPEQKEALIKRHMDSLCPYHITPSDILATLSYQLNLYDGIGNLDDIDHLGNRRVRCVGELLQNQFRIGLSRMERVVRERMTTGDQDLATPQNLLNVRPVTAAIKEFFGSSQLSQFMDQTNPMSELTHKRRFSALGPGGLSRDRAGAEVRDVHDSHYGRICPIETPEGPNIGLITSMTTYGRVNSYGFIETPYRRVEEGTGRVTNDIVYLTADEEDKYIKAQANEPLDENGYFLNERVSGRGIKGVNDIYRREKVQFMDVSPQQIVSVGAAMIPFLENDDATRALMGANMQRQAVPLIKTEAPIIGTGIEHKAAIDSGVVVKAEEAGVVTSVDANHITIRGKKSKSEKTYHILKFRRANQGTCFNQRPIVREGEEVEENQIIADGPSIDQGEIALGKNILIAFMTWEGYNYEDAMLINEQLVIDDVLTSVHIEEHTCEARETKLGAEEITDDIPNVGEDMLRNLDQDGIIRIGAEVGAGDILVGKVTPKGETDPSPEERLLRSIFGEKSREVRDASLKVPHGESGIVVDVKKYSRANGDELAPGLNEVVRVYIASKRKIMVGDKMCGRHGNKGVVSRILPVEDMPFLPDGTPIQICLNPLGIPSRMNIGQVLEVHLGLAAKKLGWHVATPVFDGASDIDIEEALEAAGYPIDGKIQLRDGRTGEEFNNRVTVGYMYILKLHHMVEEKIHARSTGPYSLVTQQPLGGKAQFGGQRFGEMEVWALEAYGASHTLQEMLTVKSDDVTGRVKTYSAIVKGENIPQPGIPESFKVLIKELQSLALDVKLLDDQNQEVELSDDLDDVTRFSQVEDMDERQHPQESRRFLRTAEADDDEEEIEDDEFDMDSLEAEPDDFDDLGYSIEELDED
ncbi:MAG: DNA-directed RNA polymerase subunit beta [Peptoniphilaceae bacterium]|nr:DNA-directed RNA polymerase subunit beta [Peptoniphilaceae bacterium]MDD7433906.1 DNA-directed RNA polymerase subunit beta [Peptoniphilaceae bacterium]MDY3075383.1 DNA-directed RNA polymerase subunit beta [Peptoniphilaceae bacterium]MDY4196765.1 DNA-directed RNA polymerase subunit beta [Peptoniphilaceae bacterium]MDY5842167.1 DNA-directed RNA polymerase subunit beta [Peptoniphilaceae bacterium]